MKLLLSDLPLAFAPSRHQCTVYRVPCGNTFYYFWWSVWLNNVCSVHTHRRHHHRFICCVVCQVIQLKVSSNYDQIKDMRWEWQPKFIKTGNNCKQYKITLYVLWWNTCNHHVHLLDYFIRKVFPFALLTINYFIYSFALHTRWCFLSNENAYSDERRKKKICEIESVRCDDCVCKQKNQNEPPHLLAFSTQNHFLTHTHIQTYTLCFEYCVLFVCLAWMWSGDDTKPKTYIAKRLNKTWMHAFWV